MLANLMSRTDVTDAIKRFCERLGIEYGNVAEIQVSPIETRIVQLIPDGHGSNMKVEVTVSNIV